MKASPPTSCFLLLFFLFPALSLSAATPHKGSISGIVRDGVTQLELGGATVELLNTDQVVYTNELGVFSFTGLEAGQYSIRVSYLAYANMVMENITVTDDSTQPVLIW